MAEILGASLILLLGLLWIFWAGRRTKTVSQSATIFLIHGILNFGLFFTLGLSEDQVTYYSAAKDLASAITLDPLNASAGFSQGKQSYVWILALLIIALGDCLLAGLAINVALMTTLPAIFSQVSRDFGLTQARGILPWVVTLSPPLLLWAPGLRRETLVFFLLSLFVFGLSKFYSGEIALGTAMLFVVGLSVSVTRSQLLINVIAGVIISLVILGLRFARKGRDLFAVFHTQHYLRDFWLVPAGATTAVGLTLVLGRFREGSFALEIDGIVRELSEPGQATSAPGVSGEFNLSVIGYLYNFARVLFGPFPWEFLNWSLIFFGLESLGYLLFFSIIGAGYSFSKDTRVVYALLLLAALPLVLGSTVYFANYGLNSRVRAHIYLLLVPLVVPFLERYVNWPKSRGRLVLNNLKV